MLIFFFFNDTATTEIYTLSLHDALPICARCGTTLSSHEVAQNYKDAEDPSVWVLFPAKPGQAVATLDGPPLLFGSETAFVAWTDRKSTRLNSSHLGISYAVFCFKKKKR